jgi:predicted O-methyltransferase YrrM
MQIFKDLGITEFGFIFIDGWHSINQVLTDWEYTALLSPNGIVGLHDVSSHPGPNSVIKAINKDIWEVEENTCPYDHGVGFAWKK